MNLKSEYIAPYLPYDLQVLFEKEYFSTLKLVSDVHFSARDHNGGEFRTGYFVNDEFRNWQLVLRPLSQLFEEIEVNGKRVIPINMLMQFWEMPPVGTQEYSYKEQYFYKMLECVDLNCIRYGQYQMLLSWHFDIFGLIKNGLAVDMSQVNLKI